MGCLPWAGAVQCRIHRLSQGWRGMTVAESIERKLAAGLNLAHLQVRNESGNHNVPPGSESHFKVVVVTEDFAAERPLARHRRINALLAEELAGPVHALSIHAYTPTEWRRRFGAAPLSPPCLGGGKGQSAASAGAA